MNRSISIATTRLSSDKRGNPRIWIEGKKLEKSGFLPSRRYKMTVDETGMKVTLELDNEGDRMVSRRSRHGNEDPVVDIANKKALSHLDGIEILRVDFRDGIITIEPSAVEARRHSREKRTSERLKSGAALRCGSVSTGLGVLSYAIHHGLEQSGIESELAFSVEIDSEYQDLCAARNPVWRDDTQAINMPLQEFAFDRQAASEIEQVDILEAGIPCTAHSRAGVSKKHLEIPEHDPVAGHLVVGFLSIVAACNPTVVIVENVPQYIESASCAILQNQLREWGYDVSINVLRGEDYGCLENRHRMALVATSKGMNTYIVPEIIKTKTIRVEDILEDIPGDSPLWSTMAYLKKKEERDREEGKGFRMQILNEASTKVGTIGRGYAKVRSTEPKLCHPTNPELLRQFTPREHARIKGIPEEMVEGLPVTVSHEMLGQSIITHPFIVLGEAVGHGLQGWISGVVRPRVNIPKPEINRENIQNDNDRAKTMPVQLGLFG